MWNKKIIRGRECFTRNTKEKLHEYTLGDLDKINENPNKWNIGYSFQKHGIVEEILEYEYKTLPSNIVNRPGRFDRFYKIAYLSCEDIEKYMSYFLNRDILEEELALFDKVTIAELKEILLLVLRDEISIKKAHDLIKAQSRLVLNEFSSKEKVGFGNTDEEDY